MEAANPTLRGRRACMALLAAPALAVVARAHAASDESTALASRQSYLDRLRAFKSKLVIRGPAPQNYKAQVMVPGAQQVEYPSGPLGLKAWVAYPAGASPSSPAPGVVFFHGGFAFAANDFEDARPFLDAGFAVLCPTLRAENGNPGNFELLLGEVDDAAAAVTWFARQPNVNATRISTFGHSIGGIVSALLSLRPAGIRHGGSSGGLFGTRMFDASWLKPNIPFAPGDPRERELRVLVGNVAWMQRPHVAYVGAGDAMQDADLAAREVPVGSRLTIARMDGDHFTSLAPSVKAFIERLKSDA